MIKSIQLVFDIFDTLKMQSTNNVSEFSCLHRSDLQIKLIMVTDIEHASTNKPPPLALRP